MNWQEYIYVDPAICHGDACAHGTRIPVSVVLSNLAEGLTIDQIIEAYPSLTGEGIRAALAYAAQLSQKRKLDVPA